MRRAAKRDANEPEIVKALKAVGVQVEILNKPLDLLLWHRATCPHCSGVLPDGAVVPMEVKNPDGGRLTKDQVEFIARWPGKVHIVETIDEALKAVLGEKALA